MSETVTPETLRNAERAAAAPDKPDLDAHSLVTVAHHAGLRIRKLRSEIAETEDRLTSLRRDLAYEEITAAMATAFTNGKKEPSASADTRTEGESGATNGTRAPSRS